MRFVDAIDKNMSLPEFLRETNRLWKKSIEKWDPNKGLENLSAMRELSKSRTSEVEAMRLIPTLLQHLNQFPGDGDTAETLYLLGENYEYSYKISMLEIPENYYELCIKQAPKTKWAKKCFERFKELTVLGYSGSGGTHIPKNVQHHLDKLKKLTE